MGRTPYNSVLTTPVSGRDTVAAAATAERILSSSTSVPVVYIDIQAETDNTGLVVIGDSGVVAALATRKGIALNAGDTYRLENVDLADVYADVTVSGDGYTYVYVKGT